MSNIKLIDEQKSELEDIANSNSPVLNRRARLILAYADGKPTMQAAMNAGISRGRARFWKRQFITRGMEIFNQELNIQETKEISRKIAWRPDDELIKAIDSAVPDAGATQIHEELSYPELRKYIGIKPEDSLAEAGKKVWSYHFAIMLFHEGGTLLGEDVEELHDMRVATRRMRTVFEIFEEAFVPKTLKRHLKGLRGIGRSLGQVRDMDVILANGLAYQDGLKSQDQPGLEPLLLSWKQTIDIKREKLEKHLQSENYQRFKREFNNFLQKPTDGEDAETPGIGAMNFVRDAVPVLLYNRYAKVRAFEAILPTATVSQLHILRIEFKKFRYTLEYFKEILGDTSVAMINEIKRIQDHLGELHDADVACQLVTDFLRSWEKNQTQAPIQTRANPKPIVTYLANLHNERYRLMVTFPELWQKFNRPEFRQNLAQAISLL